MLTNRVVQSTWEAEQKVTVQEWRSLECAELVVFTQTGPRTEITPTTIASTLKFITSFNFNTALPGR